MLYTLHESPKKATYYYTNSSTIDYDEKKKKISFNILFCDLAIVATTHIIKFNIILQCMIL